MSSAFQTGQAVIRETMIEDGCKVLMDCRMAGDFRRIFAQEYHLE
jgi:hypothetical protein